MFTLVLSAQDIPATQYLIIKAKICRNSKFLQKILFAKEVLTKWYAMVMVQCHDTVTAMQLH